MAQEKVILFPIHPSSWPTMYQLALKMKEGDRYEPVMLLTEGVLEHKDLCRSSNIEAYFFNAQCESVSGQELSQNAMTISKQKSSLTGIIAQSLQLLYKVVIGWFEDLEKKTDDNILSFSLYQVMRIPFEVVYERRYIKISGKLLGRIKPKAVYMYVDNSGGCFASFAKACQKLSVKIIVPAAAFQHQEVPACRRKDIPYLTIGQEGSPWINYLIKKWFPEQVFDYEGTEVLFYSPYELLAMWISGTFVKYPWIRGKNYCDIVCVEDTYQKNRLIGMGVEEKKIFVTSHIDCDNLYWIKQKYTRKDFNRKYGFDDQKKTIIMAPPQLYQEGYCETWEDFVDELNFLIESATSTKQNVLVVLHPKMKRDDYLFLESNFNCQINDGRTSDVIPFGDIYVSGGSSTNFWALACGLIFLDTVKFYGHSDEVFDYFHSRISVQTREELPVVLKRLCEDEEFYLTYKKLVERDNKEYFMPLDGQNTNRYLSLIEAPSLKVSEVEGAAV